MKQKVQTRDSMSLVNSSILHTKKSLFLIYFSRTSSITKKMRPTDESSPDVSWLQTTTTGTTPSKYTPSIKNGNFPSISEFNPTLLGHATTNLNGNSDLLNAYDTKVANLQDKLLENERENQKTQILQENVNKILLQNSDLEIDRLKNDIKKFKNQVDILNKENKKYQVELTHVKSEMAIIGSEPVDENVLLELKKRGPNLTVRQIAELRLFDILKPISVELEEKNSQLEKLFKKCKNFEQICSDNQISIESVSQMKNNYVEQLTRNRLELVDAKNQLATFENLKKDFSVSEIQLKTATDKISTLTQQLLDKKSSYDLELKNRIKAEKELAVIKEQLSLVSSDKKYLEGDKINFESKLLTLESEANIRWKEFENLKIQFSQETQAHAKAQARLIDLNNRNERLEKELSDTRKLVSTTDNFNKEVTLRAQHDTDLIHQKLENSVLQKNLAEEKSKKLENQLNFIRDDFERLKSVYQKDVKILESNLNDSEKRSEIYMSESLKISSKLKESEIDVSTLQTQLQILYDKMNNTEKKYDLLYNKSKKAVEEFDYNNINVPGIEDLEQAIHDQPFSTAVILARRLFQVQSQGQPNFQTAQTNTLKSQKLSKLKKSNENLLKNDLQNMLKLTNQVSKLRAVLKQVVSIDSDENRLLNLQQEYEKLKGTIYEGQNTKFVLDKLVAEKAGNVVSKHFLSEDKDMDGHDEEEFEIYEEAVHPVNIS